MQATVKKVIGMLQDQRPERQCAAAMVLEELGLRDEKIVAALAESLAEGDRDLRVCALEALLALHATKVAKQVAPLLDSSDDHVQALAAVLLAQQGTRAASQLVKELHGAPLNRRRKIVEILARNHRKENFTRLVKLLSDEDLADPVINVLRHQMERMSDQHLGELRGVLVDQLKDKQWVSEPIWLARTLQLLGYHRDAKLVSKLLPFVAPRHTTSVRLAAIGSLRRPLQAARSTDQVTLKLIDIADDQDAAVARAAVETLRQLKMPSSARARLVALSEGRHAEARTFAVGALGQAGTAREAKTLIDRLKGDDPAAREAALRALRQIDGVAVSLVKELKACAADPQMVDRLVHVLIRTAGDLKAPQRRTIAELTYAALDEDAPSADSLLRLLKAASPNGYQHLLTEMALGHRRAKRYQESFQLLRRLDEAGMLAEEERYAALVTGLNATKSKKNLGRASRTTDPVLRQAVELVTAGYPVAKKLKRERTLTPEDLFFVGFNFSESPDEDEKEFGGVLLAHLKKKSPRSKLGRSAKNKLRLVGLEMS